MSCARGTRITTEVIEAWRSCNFDTLHKALDLRPWERSPLPREVSSLGCSEGEESDSGPSHESWHQAIELQRELIKIAGWPDCRAAFEENLRDAQSRVAYAQELVDHPERGVRARLHRTAREGAPQGGPSPGQGEPAMARGPAGRARYRGEPTRRSEPTSTAAGVGLKSGREIKSDPKHCTSRKHRVRSG